jgi:hypothetical protein
MNGDTKKNLALGAIALGVGVALGAVLGNDKTRQSFVQRGKGFLNSRRQK